MRVRFIHKSTKTITPPIGKDKGRIEKIFLQGEWIIFLFLLILFPTNLAKHFPISSSYVQGVLVDYLIPKIYLTQLLVFVLLASSAIRSFFLRQSKMRGFIPFFVFILTLLPSFTFSDQPPLAFSRLAEVSLWAGFSLWVAGNTLWERDHGRILKFLSFGVGWVSLLALAQFIIQRNVFGYLFLGEPLLTPSLGGVAKTSFFGREVLQAYGTFPHPNVLGGVMALTAFWLLVKRRFLPAGLAFLSLLVSFSQVAWVAFLFPLLVLVFFKIRKVWRALIATAFIFISPLLMSTFFGFISEPSITRRIELFQSAVKMFFSSPFVGVGLGLFTAHLPTFGLPSGMVAFIQPVHNIFALVAAESGLFAFAAFAFIFVFAFRNAWRKRRFLLLASLGQLVFLGFFDHYLYTLPQGLFILGLTLGSVFSYARDNGRPAHARQPNT